MRLDQWMWDRAGKGIGLALAVIVSAGLFALIGGSSSPVAAQAPGTLEATIFSYDGTDFVRTKTTLMTEDGKSAVNTKLDHASPAYKALVQKRSYTGDATVFGKKYEASYAPLTGKDGRLTGALFVAVAK
jgi:methyl-accepting chemotaxis protein-2 (aspartate sensor receptor)